MTRIPSSWGLILGVTLIGLTAGPALAQTPARAPALEQGPDANAAVGVDRDADRRPAMPTVFGDTGFWVVPTADGLPGGSWSGSLFRGNADRKQGLTDVSNLGFTVAFGATDRLELFGSWSLVRLDRDLMPFFVASDETHGGVVNDFPHLKTGWSKNLGGTTNVGAKFNLLSQSRQDALALAPRVLLSFPTGPTSGGTDALTARVGLVASGEIGERIELSGTLGGVYRADPAGYNLSNGIDWGVGAMFPSRAPLRALVEVVGERSIREVRAIGAPALADDGSMAPGVSAIPDLYLLKAGVVWQRTSGFFIHGGVNFTPGVSDRTVGGTPIAHSGLGAEVSIGWHPGTRVYVAPPPPPPAPRVVAAPPAPAPAPPPNRDPAFSVAAACAPCTLEVGEVSRLTATASDPDGDAITYRWSAPQGSFSQLATAATMWTAPGQPGTVIATVTADDGRGGSATSRVTLQVVAREVITFDPVYFDFDRSEIRPAGITTLNGVVARLQANPDLRVTIEGHTDGVGTVEYNLALGDRRAAVVRDYLANRGVGAARMETVSFGEERPAAPNDTPANRQLNRRAEIVIIVQ